MIIWLQANSKSVFDKQSPPPQKKIKWPIIPKKCTLPFFHLWRNVPFLSQEDFMVGAFFQECSSPTVTIDLAYDVIISLCPHLGDTRLCINAVVSDVPAADHKCVQGNGFCPQHGGVMMSMHKVYCQFTSGKFYSQTTSSHLEASPGQGRHPLTAGLRLGPGRLTGGVTQAAESVQ